MLELYKKTEDTYVSKALDLVDVHIFLLLKRFWRFLAASVASVFRLFISSAESRNDPSSLHFFQESFDVFDIVYFSVLSSLIMRSQFSNFAGYSFKVFTISSISVLILFISSAYWGYIVILF